MFKFRKNLEFVAHIRNIFSYSGINGLEFKVLTLSSEAGHLFPGHSKSLLGISYYHLVAFYEVKAATDSIYFDSVTNILSTFLIFGDT